MIIKEIRKEVFGTRTEEMDKFPSLIKYIDANSNLSVQVHPNNDYAKKIWKWYRKTEMWSLLIVKKMHKLYVVWKENIKQDQIEDIIKSGNIKANLKYVDIKKGDAIYIPSGTIHAILGDTLICEIQQNSNLTYHCIWLG